jgi:hypothetical protein
VATKRCADQRDDAGTVGRNQGRREVGTGASPN